MPRNSSAAPAQDMGNMDAMEAALNALPGDNAAIPVTTNNTDEPNLKLTTDADLEVPENVDFDDILSRAPTARPMDTAAPPEPEPAAAAPAEPEEPTVAISQAKYLEMANRLAAYEQGIPVEKPAPEEQAAEPAETPAAPAPPVPPAAQAPASYLVPQIPPFQLSPELTEAMFLDPPQAAALSESITQYMQEAVAMAVESNIRATQAETRRVAAEQYEMVYIGQKFLDDHPEYAPYPALIRQAIDDARAANPKAHPREVAKAASQILKDNAKIAQSAAQRAGRQTRTAPAVPGTGARAGVSAPPRKLSPMERVAREMADFARTDAFG